MIKTFTQFDLIRASINEFEKRLKALEHAQNHIRKLDEFEKITKDIRNTKRIIFALEDWLEEIQERERKRMKREAKKAKTQKLQ